MSELLRNRTDVIMTEEQRDSLPGAGLDHATLAVTGELDTQSRAEVPPSIDTSFGGQLKLPQFEAFIRTFE